MFSAHTHAHSHAHAECLILQTPPSEVQNILLPGLLLEETKLVCLSSQRPARANPHRLLSRDRPLAEHLPPPSGREVIHPYGNSLSPALGCPSPAPCCSVCRGRFPLSALPCCPRYCSPSTSTIWNKRAARAPAMLKQVPAPALGAGLCRQAAAGPGCPGGSGAGDGAIAPSHAGASPAARHRASLTSRH